MDTRLIQKNGLAIIESIPGTGLLETENDVLDLFSAYTDVATDKVLVHHKNLPAEFFDLKTGLAGKLLLKFTMYRMKLAIVLTPDLVGDGRFKEMALETNRASREFRIFYAQNEAEEWLFSLGEAHWN